MPRRTTLDRNGSEDRPPGSRGSSVAELAANGTDRAARMRSTSPRVDVGASSSARGSALPSPAASNGAVGHVEVELGEKPRRRDNGSARSASTSIEDHRKIMRLLARRENARCCLAPTSDPSPDDECVSIRFQCLSAFLPVLDRLDVFFEDHRLQNSCRNRFRKIEKRVACLLLGEVPRRGRARDGRNQEPFLELCTRHAVCFHPKQD